VSARSEPAADAESATPSSARLGRVVLHCEVCAADTIHRVLRVSPRATPEHLVGTARCAVCHTTHPFELAVPRPVTVTTVLSDGGQSKRSRREFAAEVDFEVGSPLPGEDPRLEIRRIDLHDGARAQSARAGEAATVWLTLRRGDELRVSLIEGRKTTPLLLNCTPDTPFSVGDLLRTAGELLRIHAIRARGQTWDEEGPRFRAAEIDRLYVRRAREGGTRDRSTPSGAPGYGTSPAGRWPGMPGTRARGEAGRRPLGRR
jgi:uncharacterized Zn finger protein